MGRSSPTSTRRPPATPRPPPPTSRLSSTTSAGRGSAPIGAPEGAMTRLGDPNCGFTTSAWLSSLAALLFVAGCSGREYYLQVKDTGAALAQHRSERGEFLHHE